jgi:phospholipid N-methyltransferase
MCENWSNQQFGAIRGSRLVGKAFLVSHKPETPFDSIEGSHEYVALLAEALAEARLDIESEVAAAESEGADRRKQALLLVSYNLAKLNLHITASRRILNDLRTLRRLLLAESRPAALPGQDQVTAPDPG